MEDRELYNIAKQAMENAYAPYSGFLVGAALLCSDGRVFTGCNVENASYGASCCAERTAMFKAVSEGVRDFQKIAIAGSLGEDTPPCGICRQVMAEFMPMGNIILGNEKGEISSYLVSEFLPHGFSFKKQGGK